MNVHRRFMGSTAAHALLRVSIGYLLVIWGVDKLINPGHGVAVSKRFYFDLFGVPGWMTVFGVAEALLGVLIIAGLWRRYTYLMAAAITGVTLVGVWRSILDPWGWYLTGTNALFYPSFIIFAAVLVLLADDRGGASSGGHERQRAGIVSNDRA